MTSRTANPVSPPSWGAPWSPRWRVRGSALSILMVGAMAAAMWVLLWAFFLLGVVTPAARVRASGAEGGSAAEALSRGGARAIPAAEARDHQERSGS